MDWMKILSAIALVAMIVFIFPRAKMMMKHSPKAQKGDWQSFLLPMVAVVLFIVLLVTMV